MRTTQSPKPETPRPDGHAFDGDSTALVSGSDNIAAIPAVLLRLPEFCQRNGIRKSKVYTEIAAGRLKIRKIGRATRIHILDEQAWIASLPTNLRGAA